MFFFLMLFTRILQDASEREAGRTEDWSTCPKTVCHASHRLGKGMEYECIINR